MVFEIVIVIVKLFWRLWGFFFCRYLKILGNIVVVCKWLNNLIVGLIYVLILK